MGNVGYNDEPKSFEEMAEQQDSEVTESEVTDEKQPEVELGQDTE